MTRRGSKAAPPQPGVGNRRPRSRLRAALLGAGALLLLAGIDPALAARYGLVVGVDDYDPPVNKLHGAVNDARDIADALQKSGVDRIVLLLDKDVTKEKVKAGWDGLVAQARPGDTLIFSYAGHGGQEPAAKGDPNHPDGLAENFIMVNYDVDGPGLANRILDDEVTAWIKDAEKRGVHVIFVADSCHSGGMTRGVTMNLTYRAGPRLKIDRNELLKFSAPIASVDRTVGQQESVTFLAAVSADRLSPEISIDGNPRGALSFAFARALEGAADADHDGVTTEQELTAFVRATIEQRTDNQQAPRFLPALSRGIPVLGARSAAPDAAVSADLDQAIKLAETAAVESPLALAYRGGAGPAAVAGAAIVADEAQAELVYDVAARTVEKRVAGIVAENVAPEGLPGIVAKWRAIALLKAMAGRGVIPFDIDGGAQTHKVGERIQVSLQGGPQPFMTLFNLPPDGKVEFLYPADAGERDQAWTGKRFSLPLVVRDPPFGSEHLIAVMSDKPLDDLHRALRQLSSPTAAVQLPDILRQALQGQAISIGIVNVVTSGGQ